MKKQDIDEYNHEKIETLEDWVDFWCKWGGFTYEWRKDDGEEYLMVWINFYALKSFTKLFSIDTINECEYDFSCVLRNDCIVFPHFEHILEHTDIDEEDIKKIFE